MKLAGKLTLVVLLGIVAVLAVPGYLQARREIDLIESDTIRDQEGLGVGLALAVTRIWTPAGKPAALGFAQQANRSKSQIEICWVWLDTPQESPYLPVVPREALEALSEGKLVRWVDRERDGLGHITKSRQALPSRKVGRRST